MVQIILANAPIALLILIFLLVWIFLFFSRLHYRLKNRRLPFTHNLLRSPGRTLLQKIEILNQEITIYAAAVFVGPLLIYATLMTHLYFSQRPPTLPVLATAGALMLVLIAFCLFRLARLSSRRRHLRLGYDGEVAVGQELNRFMHDGCHVYHDFPADKFKIDHILVGKKGVFAIETKARSKSNGERRTEDATVAYNGRVLHFPKYTDTETIAQAERQSSWLSKWIESAIGEPVAVRGIVALPGWFVKRTSPNGIPVVNPKQFTSLFTHIQPRELSEEKIKRIVQQLEQKCRDVVPVTTITEPYQ